MEGGADQTGLQCSAKEKRGGRRESEREAAEKGCVRRSPVRGVETCQEAQR